MKIDDPKWEPTNGSPLDSFDLGSCIRLVDDGGGAEFLGYVYIVGIARGGCRLAINLSDGLYRCAGLFVLEPNAKVVIE